MTVLSEPWPCPHVFISWDYSLNLWSVRCVDEMQPREVEAVFHVELAEMREETEAFITFASNILREVIQVAQQSTSPPLLPQPMLAPAPQERLPGRQLCFPLWPQCSLAQARWWGSPSWRFSSRECTWKNKIMLVHFWKTKRQFQMCSIKCTCQNGGRSWECMYAYILEWI